MVTKAGWAAANFPVESKFAIPPRKKGVHMIGSKPNIGTKIKNTTGLHALATKNEPIIIKTRNKTLGFILPYFPPIIPEINGPKIVSKPPNAKTLPIVTTDIDRSAPILSENVNKLIVVTGKGLHSENEKDPYVSKDLGILKYSVPEFINHNQNLMRVINDIQDATIEDGGSGAFYVLLKKKRPTK